MKKLFICLLLQLCIVYVFAQKNTTNSKPKYIFYFIGDGMGSVHVEATDLYLKSLKSDTIGLQIKNIPLVSYVSTTAYNHPITCSAAAGTALATGNKTSLGTIGMNHNHTQSFKTIAEIARDNTFKVGILSSVFVNHATPASFYAKVAGRNDYHSIGLQLVHSRLDVFAGGIIEKSKGDTDVYEYAKQNGYKVISTLSEFDAIKKADNRYIIGSNELNGGENITNYIDRNAKSIALKDYLQKTIDILKSNGKGFFIMCEGGKIDWAAHANDIGYCVGEVIDFDNAVNVALEFYKQKPNETLIIVTADHETGGLSLGNSFMEYEVNPSVIKNQKCSNEYFAGIVNEIKKQSPNVINQNSLDSVKKYYGLMSNIAINSYDSLRLQNAIKVSLENKTINKFEKKMLYGSYEPIGTTASKIIAEKAGFGWTTFYHTGIPVPLRAVGAGSERFTGIKDNTDIAKILMEFVK